MAILEIRDLTKVFPLPRKGQLPWAPKEVLTAVNRVSITMADCEVLGLVGESASSLWLPPQLGDAQRWRILRALTLAEAGRVSLYELLKHTSSAFRQAASLVLITADVSATWLESLVLVVHGRPLPREDHVRRRVQRMVERLPREIVGLADVVGRQAREVLP